MEGGGFEPPKAEPSDLQSDPFGHSGTPPANEAGYFLGRTNPCQPLNALNRHEFSDDKTKLVRGRSPEDGNKVWSWREESNPRPADYKSAALPTELRQQNPQPFTGICARILFNK